MAPESDAPRAGAHSWHETLVDDLLGSIVVGSSFFFRVALGAPWGLRLDANAYRAASAQFRRMKYPSRQPRKDAGGRLVPFHIGAGGSWWLEVGREPSTQLTSGDFVVLPHEHPHVLRDEPATQAIGLLDLIRDSPPSPKGELNARGMGLTTRLVCGAMRFENARTNPLLAALPPLIFVKGSEDGGAPWLRLTVQHDIEELGSACLGFRGRGGPACRHPLHWRGPRLPRAESCFHRVWVACGRPRSADRSRHRTPPQRPGATLDGGDAGGSSSPVAV